jgi:putative ATP-dependent endonuclease of the OLD family
MILAEKPKRGEQHKYRPLTTIPQELQENIPVIFIGTDRNLRSQLPYSRNSLLATLLIDINADFLSPENKINIKAQDGSSSEIPRAERFKECITEAIKSLRTDEFIALEKSIKTNALHQLGFDPERDSDKLDIFFNPLTSLDFYKSLEIWVKEFDYNVNASELGAGFQNAIVIAILKAFEERRKQGAIFLIEEPEMFLHPQMQRSLYKTLRKIGETNQVIYITHSPNFVTIPEFDEIVCVRKNIDGTFITRSSLQVTTQLKEKFRKELDPERNELFFAQKILFVEGDTEKLAFPEYAKRMNIDFDSLGITVVEVGGKRNLIDFIELALSFHIPVGVIYDSDSSDFSGKREEEQKYNESIEAYTQKGVRVWQLEKNYEEQLKLAWGEPNYCLYCAKYEKTSKAIKARLFAADNEIPIPSFVEPIIQWLSNTN